MAETEIISKKCMCYMHKYLIYLNIYSDFLFLLSTVDAII